MSWSPEADSQKFVQKRAVSERNFEKHLPKQHFLFAEVSMNQMMPNFK